MYNGVGLPTPRGSGTSGHVQRNCAVLYKKDKLKHTEESKLDPISRQPNEEILEHTRKREIEVKCLELSDALEEEGYKQEEIDIKVESYRKILLEKYAESKSEIQLNTNFGQSLVQDSHLSAKAQLERNTKLRDAFGLSNADGINDDSERHVVLKTKN